MSDLDELQDRVRRLEDIAFDGDGLQRSVTRLGMNANALGEALLQVDRNQQALTRLGQDIKTVKDESADRQTVERQMVQQNRDRRRLIFLTVFPVALVLLALTFGLSEAAHDACEKRQEASRAVLDTLLAFDPEGNRPIIQEGADRIERTLRESCDEQYWMHFP